jgi:hypothetical protein
VKGKRGDVDFRGVVNAKRGVRPDGRHLGGEIGEATAIQGVIGRESDNLAGCAVDPYPGLYFESVPFNSGLKLLEPVVGEPDGAIGEDHRRQGDVQRERRMVAPAEPATARSEIHLDVRRPEFRIGLAE